jgi:two-component system chemotaxis response regulator CheB
MWSVKRLGGVCIVQKPEEAMYPSMPDSVLDYVDVDHVMSIPDIAAQLSHMVKEKVAEEADMSVEEKQRMGIEVNIAAQDNAFELGVLALGQLTPLTCPECNGALISIREGKLIRYRCHTGHAFTASSLLAETTKSVEDSLWKAIRSLEETIILLEQSSKQFAEGGNNSASEQFYENAQRTREWARKLHEFVYRQEQFSLSKT